MTNNINVTIFDNGYATFDRYTIINMDNGDVYGASTDPFHPQGFGQFALKAENPNEFAKSTHLGNKVAFEDVPEKVQEYIRIQCGIKQPYLVRVYLSPMSLDNAKEAADKIFKYVEDELGIDTDVEVLNNDGKVI